MLILVIMSPMELLLELAMALSIVYQRLDVSENEVILKENLAYTLLLCSKDEERGVLGWLIPLIRL
jgi:hypothetical protein